MQKIEDKIIKFDGKTITVKMMDDSWIINQCISERPIKPEKGVIWPHNQYCTRLRIHGNVYESTMEKFMDRYGNAAVIAWDGKLALGHMIFVPKVEARKNKMLYSERMAETSYDAKTLIIEAVGFCSIDGHEYRHRGIGRAMAEMVLNWAKANNWQSVQVYGTPTGLFPWAWLDSCIPPMQFWKKLGFRIIKKTRIEPSWQKFRESILTDEPRDSKEERKLKKDIVEKIDNGQLTEEQWAYEYDLEVKCK
ncbi:MAG: hypothetical protein ACYC3B_09090 [Sedimentisphaerales bacterium]